MKDPYKTLGVSRDASQTEIRDAYRKLASENHPDLYQNASEDEKLKRETMMKEINAAYRMLRVKTSDNASSYRTQTGTDPQSFVYIREMIERGQLDAAEQILDGMKIRAAEWYYSKACIFKRKNWYVEAKEAADRALSMDPENDKYIDLYEELTHTKQSRKHLDHREEKKMSDRIKDLFRKNKR